MFLVSIFAFAIYSSIRYGRKDFEVNAPFAIVENVLSGYARPDIHSRGGPERRFNFPIEDEEVHITMISRPINNGARADISIRARNADNEQLDMAANELTASIHRKVTAFMRIFRGGVAARLSSIYARRADKLSLLQHVIPIEELESKVEQFMGLY